MAILNTLQITSSRMVSISEIISIGMVDIHGPDVQKHLRLTYLSRKSVLGECVGALNGEQWRVVRSYFDPAYTHDASMAMTPLFQREAEKWLNKLKNDSPNQGADGRLTVNPTTSCKVLPLRVIPQSFYGEAYDDDVSASLILCKHKTVGN